MENIELTTAGGYTRAGGSTLSDTESMIHSNITILGPRDSVSRRSWSEGVTMMDHGNFWNNPAEIIFATLLYCLNIGNLWRFPTQVIQYGEGAFIYVYFVFSIIFGIPLLFFELAIGQYTDKGFMKVFHMIPLFGGLSYAMVFFSNTVIHVYDTIVIFNFVYFFSFARVDAPLSSRTDYGEMCFYENRTNTIENLHFLLNIQTNRDRFLEKQQQWMIHKDILAGSLKKLRRGEELTNEVVMVSDDLSCTFNVRNLCITFVMWLMVWVYTTNEYTVKRKYAWMIYIVIISIMIITLMATLTVKGAANGILRLFSPSWRNFTCFKLYLHAFEQSIITLGLGMGPLINFGSHTVFRTPIQIHAIITVVCTLVASVIMTMIVFGGVGVYSTQQGFSDAVLLGQEYYMHVLLSKLFRKMASGCRNLIIFLFYGAFLIAGFYSSIQYIKLMVEFIRSKWDINPDYNWEIILAFCACQFVISCGMISYHGINLLYWSAPNVFTRFSVLTLVLSETAAFALLYGMQNLCEDIEFMVGYKPNWWFRIVWYSSIVICSVVLLVSCYEYHETGTDWYGGFSIVIYVIVVILPITVQAIYTSVTAIRKGELPRVIYPQEVQTAFPDFMNWRETLSSDS